MKETICVMCITLLSAAGCVRVILPPDLGRTVCASQGSNSSHAKQQRAHGHGPEGSEKRDDHHEHVEDIEISRVDISPESGSMSLELRATKRDVTDVGSGPADDHGDDIDMTFDVDVFVFNESNTLVADIHEEVEIKGGGGVAALEVETKLPAKGFILVHVDPEGAIAENNEANNVVHTSYGWGSERVSPSKSGQE